MGKAKNLRRRVASYFLNKKNLGEKTRLLVDKIKKIRIVKSRSEIEALLLEANSIKKYNPFFNSRLTDGKAYPLIKITAEDNYPKILLARRAEDQNSVYFGPYPNTGAMKIVLKILRRIFPFQGVQNHSKRICLYYHLGLCPCPPVFDSPELKKNYRKNIKHIIKFLEGKSDNVLKDLEKERDVEADKENFEKSQELQRKINAINIVINPSYKLFEDEISPNLKEDSLGNEEIELIKALENTSSRVERIKRIECFDISNIVGKHAVGSMTVLQDGQPEKSSYRKFKIRYTKEEPNDFAMIDEVLRRRLKHEEWPYPDLLVVDGGKGQVSIALKVLKKKNLDIPLIGLAKKEETIVTSDLKEIHLPKDSGALFLIMRIRDEAHRFALTYHRNLRSKVLLFSN